MKNLCKYMNKYKKVLICKTPKNSAGQSWIKLSFHKIHFSKIKLQENFYLKRSHVVDNSSDHRVWLMLHLNYIRLFFHYFQ
jgi:hypothetical protein